MQFTTIPQKVIEFVVASENNQNVVCGVVHKKPTFLIECGHPRNHATYTTQSFLWKTNSPRVCIILNVMNGIHQHVYRSYYPHGQIRSCLCMSLQLRRRLHFSFVHGAILLFTLWGLMTGCSARGRGVVNVLAVLFCDIWDQSDLKYTRLDLEPTIHLIVSSFWKTTTCPHLS